MEDSYKVLKRAIDKVGTKSIASTLNVSSALVYKWCQQPPLKDSDDILSGAQNPLDRLKRIYEETQDADVINWLCQVADGYFVKNIANDKLIADANVLKNIQAFIKEFSETLDVISESYHKGKKITINESKLIRKEWDDLKRIGEGFVNACESGHFDKK